jgi:AraC family transcriptional regulator
MNGAMVESRGRIAEAGPVLRGANGSPLINLTDDWEGPIAQRFVIPGDAESGPMYTGVPVLFVSSSGAGKRWYRHGVYVRELETGPFIDTYSGSYERDHARWKGQTGKSIGIRIPPTTTCKLMPDAARYFNLTTRHNIIDPQLATLVRKLANEIQGGFANGRMYAQGLSLTLLAWLTMHYAPKPSQSPRARPLSETNKRRIREFIDENIGADLSLVQLATLLGVSPNHFARMFKGSFGISPHRFLLQRRIALASAALTQTADRPISDIAVAFGFVSQAHFTEAFRRVAGVTPARWRHSSKKR